EPDLVALMVQAVLTGWPSPLARGSVCIKFLSRTIGGSSTGYTMLTQVLPALEYQGQIRAWIVDDTAFGFVRRPNAWRRNRHRLPLFPSSTPGRDRFARAMAWTSMS
ncbi:hypothetical protein, partial [Mesorhizobium sp.]|uniref:hypothetical protein n=1 Tax=Mesorhizobium sp. TaxID=1871066 RepID=UPI00257E4F53